MMPDHEVAFKAISLFLLLLYEWTVYKVKKHIGHSLTKKIKMTWVINPWVAVL